MKLSFGKRVLIDDLPLDEDGPEDPLAIASEEVGVNTKFTFLGVGLDVGGIFIATKSVVRDGISRKRFLFFQWLVPAESSA